MDKHFAWVNKKGDISFAKTGGTLTTTIKAGRDETIEEVTQGNYEKRIASKSILDKAKELKEKHGN
jgi:hypothetical protein